TTGGATLHTTYVENLIIKNVNPSAWADGAIVGFGGSTNGVTVENITIDGLKPLAAMTGAQTCVSVIQKATIKRAVISNMAGTYAAAASTGHFVWVLD